MKYWRKMKKSRFKFRKMLFKKDAENIMECYAITICKQHSSVWTDLFRRVIFGPIFLQELVNASRNIEILLTYMAINNALEGLPEINRQVYESAILLSSIIPMWLFSLEWRLLPKSHFTCWAPAINLMRVCRHFGLDVA